MDTERITGSDFRSMLYAAANRLSEQKEYVDSLNVFPVPDGDTGTNMASTIMAAAKEVELSKSDSVGELAAAAAKGSLMGARGNSGVILSQFFRGFADGCQGHDTLGPKELAQAVQAARDTTYKAVMKPVEGTMLTVGRYAADAANKAAESGADVWEVVEAVFQGAQRGLEKTPELLPVLKEAGVVDAGGQGIVTILEGVIGFLRGEDVPSAPLSEGAPESAAPGGISLAEELTFKYCTEFIIKGTGLLTDTIRREISDWGDSMLVVGDEQVVKVHIHTDDPGRVLSYAAKLGDLVEIGIHNMAEQNRQAVEEREARQRKEMSQFNGAVQDSAGVSTESLPAEPEKAVGMVAVCVGQGMAEIFTSLGVDQVVVGGQTMNPSTEDLVAAIDAVPAESVILLPNNKNVLFASSQAAEMSTKPVLVVPTRTIPQGISAAMAFDSEADADTNYENMNEMVYLVSTGEVTYAVRSTKAGDLDINEQDIIGLVEGEIVVAGEDIDEVGLQVVERLRSDDAEIIAVYYGQEMSREQGEAFGKRLEELFPDMEVEVHYGGQPLYYYIIGVE
ncbi:MAG: DAK2 domain-containing protein [Firmicutes bacterium]|nr:DAK2 domain-containing protein [Bacillota bacterium]